MRALNPKGNPPGKEASIIRRPRKAKLPAGTVIAPTSPSLASYVKRQSTINRA